MKDYFSLPKPFSRLNRDHLFVKRYERNETVFRQGAKSVALYYVHQGCVELRRYTSDGESIVIHRARSGETFAEASLFSSNYHCDAITGTACILVGMKKSAVLAQFKDDPGFAYDLSARFASQIQLNRRRFELLAIRSAEERVFTALADGMLSGSIVSFAGEIGLTNEATYRALAALVGRGKIIKSARGRYSLAPK